jgi:hypothetical protein
MASVAVRNQKELIQRSKIGFDVELRGFEPLTPSMRTLSGEVARGRRGRLLFGGSLSESFAAAGVAVLLCCTAFGPSPRRWQLLIGPESDQRVGKLPCIGW